MTMLIELEDQGWSIDRWGNAKIELEDGIRRMKFQHHTIRIEKQIVLGNKKSWLRMKTVKYE